MNLLQSNHRTNPAKHTAGLWLALASLVFSYALPGYGSGQSLDVQGTMATATKESWTHTGSLRTARYGHTAILLKNGKVLVAGGVNAAGYLSSSELYDPVSGEWSDTGHLSIPRYLCTATLLENGKVLIAGGYSNRVPPSFGITNRAELYDPDTGTWSLTGDLNTSRAWHTATRLKDGKVLVAGGATTDALSEAELYDPTTGTWAVTGSLQAVRYGHTATLLENGMVLIAGGSDDGDLSTTLPSAELYDPDAGRWLHTGSLSASPILHTATLLPDGKVLVTGGYNWPPTSLSSTELYDPATGQWGSSRGLTAARDNHTATLLPGGKVLIAGGDDWGNRSRLDSAELFDPATGLSGIAARPPTPRAQHTAMLLNDGKVLIAGGRGSSNTALNSAELYQPGLSVTPEILGATVTGKKLFIQGENFDAGAVILLNGEEQTTKNDPQNPQTTLIGKKAGKRIKPGDRLQVRNPDGTISEEFTFTWP